LTEYHLPAISLPS